MRAKTSPPTDAALLHSGLKKFGTPVDCDDVNRQTLYQELCCHCTSPAIGYFERPIKYRGDASSVSWLCKVHAQVYPLDRVVFTRVAGRIT